MYYNGCKLYEKLRFFAFIVFPTPPVLHQKFRPNFTECLFFITCTHKLSLYYNRYIVNIKHTWTSFPCIAIFGLGFCSRARIAAMFRFCAGSCFRTRSWAAIHITCSTVTPLSPLAVYWSERSRNVFYLDLQVFNFFDELDFKYFTRSTKF